MVKALIFDFDGVVVDSEKYWPTEENYAFKRIMKTWTEADQPNILGMSFAGTYEYLARNYDLQMTYADFLNLYNEIAEKVYSRCRPFTGIKQLLTDLEKSGFKLAVASSGLRKWITMVLKKYDLYKCFSSIICADDIPQNKGKPAPDLFLKAAESLNVKPDQCLVIEDAANGIKAAKNAGMYCIAFKNGLNDRQDLSEADEIINSLRKHWIRL